ncbi:MAG: hypothetical protein K2K15_05410 [Anaeroplasmataceae bacterium]|nr:hypothetical protein [Anaeroplasmataceae bacterium]
MKAFQFDGTDYKDLNTLGLAFAEQFPKGLQAIQEKAFLKFVKRFKDYKKRVKQILYESRYLQNALSIMIYLFTDEHILIVGNRFYKTVQECLKDLKRNQALLYFAEDHGFSNTILTNFSDEKLKRDIEAFENNSQNTLAVEYLNTYYEQDSIAYGMVLNRAISKMTTDSDTFKTYYRVFKSREVLLALAHKTSLNEVLEITKSNCPVFKGFIASGSEIEQPLSHLEKAFYTSLIEIYKNYKYKGFAAKNLKRKIKQHKKSMKKFSKFSLEQKIQWHESLHTCYLEMVDLYRIDKVKAEESTMAFTISYCDTYLSPDLLDKHSLHADLEHEHVSILKADYSLAAFSKSIKTHRSFAIWSIVLAVLVSLMFVVSMFYNFLLDLAKSIFSAISSDSQEEAASLENSLLSTTSIWIFFAVGVAITLIMAIVILIMRGIAKRKYKKLGKLAYYRNHEAILVEKEEKEYKEIALKEEKYAKSIDRFYRFYGGIAIFGLSLATVSAVLCLAYSFGEPVMNGIGSKIVNGVQDKFYFLFIPPAVLMLLGFARHKKTAWSILSSFFLSICFAVLLIFLF